MNKGLAIFLVVLAAALVVFAVWFISGNQAAVPGNNSTTTTTTATSTPQNASLTLPGGQVSLSYPPDFCLAAAPEPLTVTSYIPPCDQGFQYCLYYNGSAYSGTNFESAGIRINQRADLKTQNACLKTQPSGYMNLTPAIYNGSGYFTSAFGPVGDAGAGHYANGALYRLYFSGNCYEFETRIGETQFANYPPGAIQQFTDADRTALFSELQSIIQSAVLNGSPVTFPPAPTSTLP